MVYHQRHIASGMVVKNGAMITKRWGKLCPLRLLPLTEKQLLGLVSFPVLYEYQTLRLWLFC